MSLKVCYLLPRLIPVESGIIVGGCTANCVSLALELRRQGVHIEILAPVSEKCLEFLFRHPVGEIVRPLPSIGTSLLGKGIGAIQVLRRCLKECMQEMRCDVVHSHSGTYPYAIAPMVANRKRCVRLHSLYCPLDSKGGVYSNWWEKPFAAKFIFNRLDKIIAVTENVNGSLVRAGVDKSKLQFIPMSVDTRRFFPKKQDGENIYFPKDRDAIKVLFIGNASKAKGLIELLDATRILLEKKQHLNLVATIENQSEIQEYSDREEYVRECIKKFGIGRHVRLIGLVDAIEDLYAETDLVIIPWNTSRGPSDYPMVGLEAMAMKKCIVSTPIGGCPELLGYGKAGILTEGFSAVSIAAAMEFAMKHPEVRKQVGAIALEAAKKFSLKTVGKQMINLYESLLEGRITRNEKRFEV